MKLKEYALIAEIVGGFAVIIGLVFVGLELRQNTIAQRVTATQTLVENYSNAADFFVRDTESACIHVRGNKGLENLTGVERIRYSIGTFNVLRAVEQLHFYSLEGMVDQRIWRGFQRQLDEVMRYPGVMQYWQLRRDWFSDEFQEFIDGIHKRQPVLETVPLSVYECESP
jgi:hypothetical protein